MSGGDFITTGGGLRTSVRARLGTYMEPLSTSRAITRGRREAKLRDRGAK
jgi:hypothetical protein